MKFISNDAGVDWVVNIVISEFTYEEYSRMGGYLGDEYISLRDRLFYWLGMHYIVPKYDFHKSKEVARELVEEYRNDEDDLDFITFKKNIMNRLFF